MAEGSGASKYPIIDVDPHFRRVVGNFRQSDYVAWGAGTAAFPGALYFMEMFDPTQPKRSGFRTALRLSTFLGACGGFLLAYQRSSFRFWGWAENAREAARAEAEGLSAPGLNAKDSGLDPYMQGVAHRNSAYSQLKFSVLPWFNFVNHPYHKDPQSESS